MLHVACLRNFMASWQVSGTNKVLNYRPTCHFDLWLWLWASKTLISTEGALILPTTYDNHPIQSHPIPSVRHIPLNELNWPKIDLSRPPMTSNDVKWPPMTSNGLQWPLMTFNNLFMAIFDYFWPFLAISGHFWLFLTISGYFWLFVAISDCFWL